MFRNNYDNDSVTLYVNSHQLIVANWRKLTGSTARRKAASSRWNTHRKLSSKDR